MKRESLIQPTEPLSIFAEVPAAHDGIPVYTMLHPFLGRPPPATNDPESRRCDGYYATASRLFALTDRARAQVAVLPWGWEAVREDRRLRAAAKQYCRRNAAAGLQTLIFFCHDSEEVVGWSDTLMFRTSLAQSRRGPQEYALPAWPVERPAFPPRPLSPVPVVGFCGASYRSSFRVPNWFRRHFRPARCRYERVHPRDRGLRACALDQLAGCPSVQTLFIEREAFAGGAFAAGGVDQERLATVRAEFVQNLRDSDYALCLRGGGNFSYRLYEAMSLGRIPVFVNTDCVLPWDELIDWHDLCLWVEQRDILNLGDIVAREHRRLTPEAFAAKQGRCRRVWEEHLSPLGFFATLRAWLPTVLKPRSQARLDRGPAHPQ